MRFLVEVTETLQKSVEVEAKTAEEAVSDVRRRYRSGEIALDASGYVDATVEVVAPVGAVGLCAG